VVPTIGAFLRVFSRTINRMKPDETRLYQISRRVITELPDKILGRLTAERETLKEALFPPFKRG
jgi:hypothetical protein